MVVTLTQIVEIISESDSKTIKTPKNWYHYYDSTTFKLVQHLNPDS